MAHLGQSIGITTVEEEEIVLTGSDGQTFKMKVVDFAEAIRKVMPIATTEKNGLLNASNLRYIEKKGMFFLSKNKCIKLYSCISTTNVSFLLCHDRIEGVTAKMFFVSFSMASNGHFEKKAVTVFNGSNIYPTLCFKKVGNLADIYLVTNTDYSYTSILPIIENGNYTYHMIESVLPTETINIEIE